MEETELAYEETKEIFESIMMEVREISPQIRGCYTNLFANIVDKRQDKNQFATALRIFKYEGETVGFPPIELFQTEFGHIISSLYIFKLHHQYPDGNNFGIYTRLTGYAPRGMFEKFISECVQLFCGQRLELKAVLPVIKKDTALFDYLQTLYLVPTNLFVNFSNRKDAMIAESPNKIDHSIVGCLKERIQKITTNILDNIVTMPSKYPSSFISRLITMPPSQFKIFMKQSTIMEICMSTAQDAYNMAIQDRHFKSQEVQSLLDPLTRRSILNKCVTEKITKQVQFLMHNSFDFSFIHPHVYNNIATGRLSQILPMDPLLLDSRFLFPLLLVSRWFAKTCMRHENYVSNNHAHLVLYGGAGTGKTLIVSAIASCVSTYRYLSGSRFQNPDLLNSSLVLLEEFDTSQLTQNHYKQLLDLKANVKIDFKNLHPESVTEGVPCMITTNDEILSVLKMQRRHNPSSVDAALRRLYMIPLKMGVFENMHGRMSAESPHYETLKQFDGRFDTEQNKLQRIMNMIFSFAIFQQDVDHLYLDQRLHPYIQKIAMDFKNTCFGSFYLFNKKKVDELIRQFEESMVRPDMNDSEFLTQTALCVGQFQQILAQFLADMCTGLDTNIGIVKDSQIPWPVRIYYLLTNHRFIAKLMWQTSEQYTDHLNKEVKQYIENLQLMPFVMHQDEHVSVQSEKLADQPGIHSDDVDSMLEGIDKLGKRSVSQRLGLDYDIQNQ